MSDFNISNWDEPADDAIRRSVVVDLTFRYDVIGDNSSVLRLAKAMELYAADLRDEHKGKYNKLGSAVPSWTHFLQYDNVRIENIWEVTEYHGAQFIRVHSNLDKVNRDQSRT